jgi:hypothetical protein
MNGVHQNNLTDKERELKEKLLRYGKMQQVPLSFNQWDYMKDANQ